MLRLTKEWDNSTTGIQEIKRRYPFIITQHQILKPTRGTPFDKGKYHHTTIISTGQWLVTCVGLLRKSSHDPRIRRFEEICLRFSVGWSQLDVCEPAQSVPVVTVGCVPPVRSWGCAGEVWEEGRGEETQWAWTRESRKPRSLHASGIGKRKQAISLFLPAIRFSDFPFPAVFCHHQYSQVTIII